MKDTRTRYIDGDSGWWAVVVPPKVPSRGYESLYREEKIAAHTTRGGKGKVAKALTRKRGK